MRTFWEGAVATFVLLFFVIFIMAVGYLIGVFIFNPAPIHHPVTDASTNANGTVVRGVPELVGCKVLQIKNNANNAPDLWVVRCPSSSTSTANTYQCGKSTCTRYITVDSGGAA